MLTFEEILEAFRKHLDEDDSVEVVRTRRGYTVLDWDDGMEDWASAQVCRTPEKLRQALRNRFEEYLNP